MAPHTHTTRDTRPELQLTDVVGEKDDKERRDEVVDSLDVATGWVPHGPDEQYPLKALLNYLLLKQGDIWIHPRYIDIKPWAPPPLSDVSRTHLSEGVDV